MGLFSFFKQTPTKTDLDAAVLEQLKKAGSELGQPHEIDFFLYFPTRALAEVAAEEIRAEGADVGVQEAAAGGGFLCATKKKMVPDLAELQRLRVRFAEIAVEFRGEYDGWGASVVKEF